MSQNKYSQLYEIHGSITHTGSAQSAVGLRVVAMDASPMQKNRRLRPGEKGLPIG